MAVPRFSYFDESFRKAALGNTGLKREIGDSSPGRRGKKHPGDPSDRRGDRCQLRENVPSRSRNAEP